jgi:hypothetical protein
VSAPARRSPKVRKDNVDAFSIAQALRLPRFPTRLAGRVARLPVGKAARIIKGKLQPDRVKFFEFGENPTTNEDRCNPPTAGFAAKS